MMDAATEVARIKTEFAARDSAWEAAILARLKWGNATTRELRDVIGCPRLGPLQNALCRMRKLGLITVSTQLSGQTGRQLNIWTLGEVTQ